MIVRDVINRHEKERSYERDWTAPKRGYASKETLREERQ